QNKRGLYQIHFAYNDEHHQPDLKRIWYDQSTAPLCIKHWWYIQVVCCSSLKVLYSLTQKGGETSGSAGHCLVDKLQIQLFVYTYCLMHVTITKLSNHCHYGHIVRREIYIIGWHLTMENL
ncbi:hypothetical protein PanWU01x14_216180, partial [Parasponia andersonii]